MSSLNQEALASRLRLIDLFRLVAIIFIVFFHTWMIFHGDSTAIGSRFKVFSFVESVGRPFLFHSGLFIMAISFFLFGYSGKSLSSWRLLVFLFGIFVVQYRGQNTWESALHFDSWRWGVFTFLIVVYSFLMLTQRLRHSLKIGLYCSTLLLFFIQSYQVTAYIQAEDGSLWYQMLVGSEIESQLHTGWFLIPWFSYPVFFFGFGLWTSKSLHLFRRLHFIWDSLLFVALIFSVLAYLESSPNLFIDGRFDKGIFEKSFLEALPFILIPFFIFRLSLLNFVQAILNHRFFGFISSLAWNKHFWIAYLYHLLFLFIAFMLQKNSIWIEPPLAEFLPVIAFVFAERATRASVAVSPQWRSRLVKWGWLKNPLREN